MQVPVTALYAAIYAVLILVLAWQVTRQRRRLRVGMGSGGHDELDRAARVHANAVEYLPLALLLMVVYELNGAPVRVLHLCGAVLLFARLIHAWGLSHSSGTSFGRFYGTAGTWLVILALAVLNIAALLGFGNGSA